jgi:uncharacterized membrane protein
LIIATAPRPQTVTLPDKPTTPVDTDEAFTIIQQRCVNCHAPAPEFAGYTSAPLGVELDNREKLLRHAERVNQTVVVLRTMPLGNFTKMTDAERDLIARWFEGLHDAHKK